jgi:serine/threonine protein phosphatase PrpC
MDNQSGWVVGGASSIGCRHIEENTPIEDNCYYESWGNGWGIAVVSDGAGSREKSAIGSRLVSHLYAPRFLKNNLKQFYDTSVLPSSAQWQKISLRSLYECAYMLTYYSTEHNDDVNLYGRLRHPVPEPQTTTLDRCLPVPMRFLTDAVFHLSTSNSLLQLR